MPISTVNSKSKNIIIVSLILTFVVGSINPSTPVIGSGGSIFNGHEYLFISDPLSTWSGAKADCEARGGHLVTITSGEENAFVASLIGSISIWIGYTDEVVEGTWQWITSEAVTYENWAPGEPNNSPPGENYTELYPDGTWNDVPNGPDTPGGYVCEFDVFDLESTYFESFESGVFTNWTATGLWHVENNSLSAWPLLSVPSVSHYAWYGQNSTGDYNTTGGANSGNLTSISLDLASRFSNTPLELKFWSKAETESNESTDLMTVEISSDNGITWTLLGYVNDSTDWESYSFDVSPYISTQAQVRFGFDTITGVNNTFRGWMLDNVEFTASGFDLEIYHSPYVLQGEWVSVDFMVQSRNFTYTKTVNITLLVTTPSGSNKTLSNETLVSISPDMAWYSPWFDYYPVNGDGTYIFDLLVIDQQGEEWKARSLLTVGPHLSLHIGQEQYAYYGDTKTIWFSVDSHYSTSKQINVSIIMTMPNNTESTLFTGIDVIPSQQWWDYEINYTYLDGGEYFLRLNVTEINPLGRTYVETSRCVVGPYVDSWVDHDNEALAGDEKDMVYAVQSYFDFDTVINISMRLYTPNQGDLILDEAFLVNLPAFGSWERTLSYQFMEPGHYDAHLEVVENTNGTFYGSSNYHFDIYEGIRIWMDLAEGQYSQVGEETPMGFVLRSHVTNTVQVDVHIYLLKEGFLSDTTTTLVKDSFQLQFLGWLNFTQTVIFNTTGEYKLIMEATVTQPWDLFERVERLWDVGRATDTRPTNTTDDSSPPSATPSISSGFEYTFALPFLVCIILWQRRRRLKQ